MNTQPKVLLEDLEMNHEYCSAEVILQAATELRRLYKIEEAAKNLVKVKGRYHTEQAFNSMKELLK